MTRNAIRALALTYFIAVAGAGAQADQVDKSVVLHSGDRVQVTVYNHPDLSANQLVHSDGTFAMPVVGPVHIGGMPTGDASAIIADRLHRYIKNAAVDVRLIDQGQFVFVSGSTVGVLPYSPGETLVSAIGGTRPAQAHPAVDTTVNSAPVADAKQDSIDLRNVRLDRDGKQTGPYNVEDLARHGESGPALHPGDTILLSNKPVRVDVLGDVRKAGPVYLYPGETLAQAVDQAGGVNLTAATGHIGLTRAGETKDVSFAGTEFTTAAQNGDTVQIAPANKVNVIGMVGKPGETLLRNDSTLLSALYLTEGPNRYADLKNVQVIHKGVRTSYNITGLTHGDLTINAPLSDGDVVFVPEGHKIDLSPVLNTLGIFINRLPIL